MSGSDETNTRLLRVALPRRRAHQRRRAQADTGGARTKRASLISDPATKYLLDAAPDAMVVVDEAHAIALVNRGAEGLLGYQRHELLGQPFGILVAEHDRESTLALLYASARAALIEAEYQCVEVMACSKDGTVIPVEVSLSAFRRAGRKIVVAAIRDISARRRLEGERLELLAREQEARLQAEAAVRVRNSVLAMVPHDLKQPLTVISARADLIEDLALDVTDAQVAHDIRKSASRISAKSTAMRAALNELTDVARVQGAGPLEMERTPVNLAELIQRVVDELCVFDRCAIRVDVPPEPVLGLWDRHRLDRVVQNLLENALKYSPNQTEVSITVKQEDGFAVIEVTDNGIGIPPADLEYIFDWFRRGSNSASIAPGTGLGLSGVRHVVEQHGGAVSVSSEEGKGSTFVVRLPLEHERHERAHAVNHNPTG